MNGNAVKKLQSARCCIYTNSNEPPLRPLPRSHRFPRDQELREIQPPLDQHPAVETGSVGRETLLPHSADAIFTQLEDELIHLKNQFCQRAKDVLRYKPNQQSQTSQLLETQLQIFNNIREEFQKINGDWLQKQSNPAMGDRIGLKISQAMIEYDRV